MINNLDRNLLIMIITITDLIFETLSNFIVCFCWNGNYIINFSIYHFKIYQNILLFLEIMILIFNNGPDEYSNINWSKKYLVWSTFGVQTQIMSHLIQKVTFDTKCHRLSTKYHWWKMPLECWNKIILYEDKSG